MRCQGCGSRATHRVVIFGEPDTLICTEHARELRRAIQELSALRPAPHRIERIAAA